MSTLFEIVHPSYLLFPALLGTMIDRVQEGMLAFLYLGRLVDNYKTGFASNAAFQSNGAPVLDESVNRTY